MVVAGNLVAVAEAEVGVADDRRHMADASRRADAVPCVRIMAVVAVIDVFSAPIRDVVRAPACYPGHRCATPDHPDGKNIC